MTITRYKVTRSGHIVEQQFDRETAHNLYWRNNSGYEHRIAKRTNYETWHDTRDAAEMHAHEITGRAAAHAADRAMRNAAQDMHDALVMVQSYGCPVCNGDCGSANPPVMTCPMQTIHAALAKARGEA